VSAGHAGVVYVQQGMWIEIDTRGDEEDEH
jgi:hypothetical protein